MESFHLFRNPKSEITPNISTISPSSQYSLSLDEIFSSTRLGIDEEAIANSKAIFSFFEKAVLFLKSQISLSCLSSEPYLSAALIV